MDKIVQISDIIKHTDSFSIDDDIAVFTTSMCSPLEKFPLRIDALMIILCKQGSGRIGIDLKEYDISENSIVVIQPRNYIQLLDVPEDGIAKCLICSRHVVEDVLPKLTDLLPLLMHNRTDPVSQLSDSQAKGIESFYNIIEEKMNARKTPFLKQKLLCLLKAALFELMDFRVEKSDGERVPRSRKEEIMARFILTVGDNFKESRQVNFYARKLCITAKHLSAVVKSLTGMTAGEWIDNYVIMEAKVLLRTTDLTIQQVAGKLNFMNQSFFGKYFKHMTGMTPSQYRKQNA